MLHTTGTCQPRPTVWKIRPQEFRCSHPKSRMGSGSQSVKRTSDVDVAVRVECELGEGPRWDVVGRRLLFVDVLAGRLLAASEEGTLVLDRAIGQSLGAVNCTTDGGLALCAGDGIHLAAHDGTDVRLLAPVEADRPESRMNDAACDPAGRLWAGTMAFDATPGAGTLYRVDLNDSLTAVVSAVVSALTISNGLGWSPDARHMYFVDSPTRRIDVFDYDLPNGTASNRRALVEIEDTPGVPDGLTVDVDGGIWVALWGGSQVRRYAPDGELTVVIDLPVEQPTSCTFGGRGGDVLYITTARYGLSAHQLAGSPTAGSVLACRPGHRGNPAFAFGPHGVGTQ